MARTQGLPEEAGESSAEAAAPGGFAWLLALAGLGALWGAVSYTILWGETSIVVTRRFVDSNLGLLALLPVRLVIEGIHLAELHVARHSFDFSRNHAWIGILAAMVGAAVLAIPFLLARTLVRRRRRGGSR